jgi:hypothetical protein
LYIRLKCGFLSLSSAALAYGTTLVIFLGRPMILIGIYIYNPFTKLDTTILAFDDNRR